MVRSSVTISVRQRCCPWASSVQVDLGSVTRFNTGVLEITLPTSCAAASPEPIARPSPETDASNDIINLVFMIVPSCLNGNSNWPAALPTRCRLARGT
jgi:hypothetical protein